MIRILHTTIFFTVLAFILSCTNVDVPTISIIKDDPIGWNKKEYCIIKYQTEVDSFLTEAKIKCRGGSSSRYYKHSFSLELEDHRSLNNLPADDDWVLNANYIDKTFMRHKISYDIFSEMNPNNIAPKSAYLNVEINKKYEGLYVLMQEINGSMLNLNKEDSTAVLFKDPPIFYKEKLSWVQDSLNYYQQKYPKINKVDKTKYIEEFQDFIFNSTDVDFTENVQDWVDLENVIDWHLLLLFTNNSDGIVKNFFLYKLNADTPLRFAIWDYDHSFGRDGDNEKNLLERILDCRRAVLLQRLLDDKSLGYEEKLKNRWHDLRNQGIISVKNFEKHIDRNDKIISEELVKNFTKWPINDKNYYDANTYEQELDLMREFVQLSIKRLDQRFAKNP